MSAEQLPLSSPPDLSAVLGEPGEAVRLRIGRASQVETRRVRFLWDGWLPLGVVALLGGRGGVGKSTLSEGLAAQITRGELPGEFSGRPRSVLVCATEDSWRELIVPRLVAAGADLERVIYIRTDNGDPGSLLLPRDKITLEEIIKAEDVAMALFSPLVSHLHGGIDTHVAKDVRDALEPLVEVAERTRCTMLGIVHPNKSGATDPFNLIGMSGAFQDAARVVLYAVEDPEDEDAALLGISKTNIGKRGLLHSYRIVEAEVEVSDGMTRVPKVLWGDVRPGMIEDVLAAGRRKRDGRVTATDEAGEWLGGYLLMRDGAAPCAQVLEDGEAAGHTPQALRRARASKGVLTRRTSVTPSETFWVVPDPKGERTGEVRVPPTSIRPLDPDSARGYSGRGQVVGPDARGRWAVVEWSSSGGPAE